MISMDITPGVAVTCAMDMAVAVSVGASLGIAVGVSVGIAVAGSDAIGVGGSKVDWTVGVASPCCKGTPVPTAVEDGFGSSTGAQSFSSVGGAEMDTL